MTKPECFLGRLDPWLRLAALAVSLALLLRPPAGLLDKADHAAYAVCHRIPERTFIFAGRPLPLCARCSGTYLAALAGIVALIVRRRGRATAFPRGRWLIVLGLFMLAWVVDGVNSFLGFFPGAPQLYPPNNLLRLVTGTLEGLVIAAFLLPVLNLALWAEIWPGRSVTGWGDLVALLSAAAIIVGLVSSRLPVLLYPFALLSGLAVVGLLGALNTVLALAFLRREGRARGWSDVLTPALLGLALALAELAAIGAARDALVARLGPLF